MVDSKTNPDELFPVAANNQCIDSMKYQCGDDECHGNIIQTINGLRESDDVYYY